ncbi:MAG: hypothetical protein ACKVRN_12680 [Pyrinomonadaceae bacterium]
MSKISLTNFAIFASLFSVFCITATAQSVVLTKTDLKTDAATTRMDDETQTRVRQLETQVQKMQEQIDALTNLINRTPKTQIASGQIETAPDIQKAETAKIQTKPSETLPAANPPAPQKALGVDIGSARLTPYGTIYFNAFRNNGGTNNADAPLFATPTGNSNVGASVRQTRLGLKLEGAKVGTARLSAILEADFFGGFPSVGIGENFGIVRLRLANARLDWEKTSITVGQDWMVFAPANPTSLAAAAIPQMAASGNNWARLPQIKIERKLNDNFTWTGAILAPQTGDFSTNAAFFLQPTSGASSTVPFFQSRIAFADTNWLGTRKGGSVGLSAHYGRSRVFTGATANIKNDIDSVGIALDWNFPLAQRLSLFGEAFFGRNLGGFQAGVFQNYNNDFAYRNGTTLLAGGVRSIGTRGGWAQLGFTPDVLQDRLSLYSSIGIDDPRDEDLISRTPRDFRRQNLAFAFNLIYKFTPQFQFGGEFRLIQTLYLITGRRTANHINLSAAYSF